MTTERSPLDIAIDFSVGLAKSGYRVLWIDKVDTHSEVLDALEPHAVDVIRVRGRRHARFVSGGQVKLISTDTKGGRGFAADAVFATGDVLEKHWEDIVPFVATSQLPGVGPIYRLPERA